MNNTYHIPAEREIVTQRTINHPKDQVFKAWSDPDLLKNWWGPEGFTNTFNEFDFRPGGTWSFVMHGPDKGDYKNEVTFIDIKASELIVWDRVTNPLFRIVTTFESTDDARTLLIFRMQFATEKECEKLKKYVVDKNEENFDKLERLLSGQKVVN